MDYCGDYPQYSLLVACGAVVSLLDVCGTPAVACGDLRKVGKWLNFPEKISENYYFPGGFYGNYPKYSLLVAWGATLSLLDVCGVPAVACGVLREVKKWLILFEKIGENYNFRGGILWELS